MADGGKVTRRLGPGATSPYGQRVVDRDQASPPMSRRHLVRKLAVQIAITDVYRTPDYAAEVVTQALLGAVVTAYPAPIAPLGWARVRLTDYVGWAPTDALGLLATTTRAARTAERVAVVVIPQTAVYAAASGDEPLMAPIAPLVQDDAVERLGEPLLAFATTTLPLLAVAADRAQVALPGTRAGWIDLEAITIRPTVAPHPAQGVAPALSLAQALVGVPYLWGGVSAQGLDCSGLTQLCYRQAGVIIPRDADQQYLAIPYVVARGEVMAGDLLFFGQAGAISHVGLALNNTHLLHANGHAGCVTINTLDPGDAEFTEYSARLLAMYAGARRPLPAEGSAPLRTGALRGGGKGLASPVATES